MAARTAAFFRRWWSVVIAVAFGGVWLGEVLSGVTRGSDAVNYVFLVMTSLAFTFTRRYALGASLIVMCLFVLQASIDALSLGSGTGSGLLAVATTCVFGTLPRLRERVTGLAVMLAGAVALITRLPDSEFDDGVSRTGVLISNVLLFTLVWAVAWIIASRVRATQVLRERAERLEEERELLAREAVAEERARIARELHDVVAHSVSVMTVQAGGVRRLLTDEHVREREALAAIEDTGRQALSEMRRMVGVMRADGAPGGDREPQPGLGNLDRLVDEIRDAGLPVTLAIDGAPAGLPPGLDLSAYRIVQEGLTNALRHAGPAHAWVRLTYDPALVEILVEDDGAGPRGNGGAGHGLIGMRERVAVYGGTLETGSRPGGGFRVRATLPIDFEDG